MQFAVGLKVEREIGPRPLIIAGTITRMCLGIGHVKDS
jgi:hypothetical protein